MCRPRASTRDVDLARRLQPDVTEAVDRVGARHDLKRGWLNDAAAAFWPSDVGYDECDTVFEHPALVVRTLSPEVIFVMRLYRADLQDREDLIQPLTALHLQEPRSRGRLVQTFLPLRA